MSRVLLHNGSVEADVADLTDDEVAAALANPSMFDDELREKCHGLFAGTGDERGFLYAYAQMHERRYGVPFTVP
jgi:hypothetical protein